jgi:hypothetical protein
MLSYTPAVPQLPFGLSISSLFPIQLGMDTSNNFALSLSGLAVRTPDGRFVTKERHRDRLLDVTALTVPVNPYVYRLPVTRIHPGDLIVTADPPNFSALYVVIVDPEGRSNAFVGLDTGTAQQVLYIATRNPFLNFYVRAVSLIQALAR